MVPAGGRGGVTASLSRREASCCSSGYTQRTPAWYPATYSEFRGRHPRGEATRLSPSGHYRGLPSEVTSFMLRLQSPLPDEYTNASASSLADRIAAAKSVLGSRVFVLGHHYQRDEVMAWADARGDSFGLSRKIG